MRSLPRLPRRRPNWQRNSLTVLGAAGLAAGQFVLGITLGFASLAVADTVTTSPTAHQLVAFGLIIGAGIAAWVALLARGHRPGRRQNQSSDSQAYNLSNRGLSGRFRRG